MADTGKRFLCGEYSLILTNLGRTANLFSPISSSARIKYTSLAVSSKYIVFGASTGGLYVFDRSTFKYLKLIANKDGPIAVLRFSNTSLSIIGAGTSVGKVLVWDIGASSRDKPKCIKRTDEHKGIGITSLCWDECDSRLFVGDANGSVSVIHVTSVKPLNKGFSFPHMNEIVHKCNSQIVQLDYAVDCLLISTLKGCTMYNFTRDGPYGACFFRQEQWNYPAIYCARPGSRLWEVSFEGQVLSTQQYKKLLATPPAVILGYEYDIHAVQEVDNNSPKAAAFSRLLCIRDRFLVTWNRCGLYIVDPIVGRVVCWVNLHRDIVDICCLDNQLYIHHADAGQVTWFGLLSVKECVAALFNMNELKQATEVCLQHQDDIIVGSARDMVPKSLIVRLKENIRDKDEIGGLVSFLEALEQQLEENCPVEEFSVPRLLGVNAVKAASVISGDLGPIAVGSGSGFDDDDNLSVSQVEEELKAPNQSSTDISLENMLVSAAVLAKRLKNRGRRSPFRRTLSPDNRSPAEERSTTPEGEPQGSPQFATEETDSAPEEVKAQKYVAEKDTGETPEGLAYLSDESDTKPSVSEDNMANEVVTQELLINRKERSNTKERKKKKRKVVTVDIDTPKYKSEEGEALITERRLSDGSASTYASFGQTEVQDWSSDQGHTHSKLSPVPTGTTEYAPAIPAMLTKAKGLLVRWKTTDDEEFSPAESSTPSPILAVKGDAVIETVIIECPNEVKEFIQLSNKTREKVKNPSVLYNPDQLFDTLSEWIPYMDKALAICEKLGISEKGKHLKTFLDEDECECLTLLLHMCFDIGIYEYSASNSPGKPNRKTDLGSCIADRASFDSGVVVQHQSEDQRDVSQDTQCETNCSSAPALAGRGHNSFQDAAEDSTYTLSEKGDVQVKPNSPFSETQDKHSGSAFHCRISDSSRFITSASQLWHCKWCIQNLAPETPCSLWQTLKVNTNQQKKQTKEDCERAQFVKRFFSFLDLRKLRKTLRLLRGCKHHVYKSIHECLKDVCEEDTVSEHIREGDARRALHVLHDGIADYCDILIYHLPKCYALDGRETVLTCARLFPDVQPWEVAEMCSESMSQDEPTNAENFVFYVDQLMRWREEVGIERERTVSILCKDETTLLWWTHCSLLADISNKSPHCSCGLPRAGSHQIPWKHSNHLEKVLNYLSQQSQTLISEVIRLFWQHGYWTGFLTLCTHVGLRQDALQVICFLGDIQLLKAPQKWGLLPKNLEDWRFLVEFLTREMSRKCGCTPCSEVSGWIPSLNFQNMVDLALNRLGTMHTIQLLETVPIPEGFSTKTFLYKCIMGAMIEKRQRDTIEELLKKLDSYLWSQRPGVLVPSLSQYKEEEELQTSMKDKDPVAYGQTDLFIRTLEDAGEQLASDNPVFKTIIPDKTTHWGSNIRLADAECHVCGQSLREQVSSSIQGLIVFECSHVFHKHCLPEHACVVCFHRNLTSVAAT